MILTFKLDLDILSRLDPNAKLSFGHTHATQLTDCYARTTEAVGNTVIKCAGGAWCNRARSSGRAGRRSATPRHAAPRRDAFCFCRLSLFVSSRSYNMRSATIAYVLLMDILHSTYQDAHAVTQFN